MPSFLPPFRNAFTDLLITSTTAQTNPNRLCGEIELNLVRCLEAYGHTRGLRGECKDYADDLRECLFMGKQNERAYLIQKERRQRKKYEEPPAFDIYQ